MDQLATRHLLTWNLFFCVCSIGLFRVAANALPQKLRGWVPAFALVVFLLPIAVIQNRLSSLEAAVSGREIQSMRAALWHWLDTKGYENQRYLLVVRPLVERPPFEARLLGDTAKSGENTLLSSAGNPISIPWMIAALLRERPDHPVGRSVGLMICVFDQACARRAIHDSHTVVIGLADSVSVIRSSERPYVINLSLLTEKPVVPVVELVDGP
jgi:hypothetical protein